jgi:hypothetical protein
MTPKEIEIEVAEAIKREQRENDREMRLLKLLDNHFAIAHTITHNANFKRSAKMSDYTMLADDKKQISAEAFALDAKLRAEAMERIREKRRKQILTGDT